MWLDFYFVKLEFYTSDWIKRICKKSFCLHTSLSSAMPNLHPLRISFWFVPRQWHFREHTVAWKVKQYVLCREQRRCGCPGDKSKWQLWSFVTLPGGFGAVSYFIPLTRSCRTIFICRGLSKYWSRQLLAAPFRGAQGGEHYYFQGCQPIPHTSLMCKYRQRCQIPFSFSKQEIGDTASPPSSLPPLPSTFLYQFLPSSNTKVCFWPCSRIDLGACNLR